MKKTFIILLSAVLILGFGTSAMAAYDVRTAITSQDITGTQANCEKYGAVTFTFQQGAKLYDGDWFYFDLPRGVQLCKKIDFVVLGSDRPYVAGNPGVPTADGTAGNGLATTVAANGTVTALGAWKVIDLGSNGVADGITVAGGATGMYLRVYGLAGTRRVNFQFYDNQVRVSATTGIGLTCAENQNGNTVLTVGADTNLTLSLFDGEPWNSAVATIKNPTGAIFAVKDSDTSALTGNTNFYGFYGDDSTDMLQVADATGVIPYWDNYICAEIPDITSYTGGDYINVSFDSGGVSGNAFITFQGQREIAHIVGAQTITMEACQKRDLCGYVALTGGQGSTCSYSYNSAAGYCSDSTGRIFKTLGGNRVAIKAPLSFGSSNDEFFVRLTITGTGAAGTFFGGTPASILAVNPLVTGDACDALTGTSLTPTWTAKNSSGAIVTTFPTGAGCAAVTTAQQAVTLESSKFGPLNAYNRLIIGIPTLVYVPSSLTNGTIAEVRVEVYKNPCGMIFNGTRCMANYISTCASAVPQSTLMFPYAVALNGSTGWWFGLAFSNPSTAAGTAVIKVYEMDGDQGTFTTPTIEPGRMVVYGDAQLLNNLTPVTGNTGTLGDSACHIVVTCNFGFAGGFGMMGNGSDSTGYSAYGISGAAVGDWTR